MRLWLFSTMAGIPPATLLAMSEFDAGVAILTTILGGGGLFGVVKLWLAASAKREGRADERLSSVIEAARQEREKDRSAERAERERQSERFDAALQRSVVATERLTEEVRGLREDVRTGSGCRAPR